MAYVDGEVAIQTYLQSLPFAPPDTVTRKNWHHLNSGRAKLYIVLKRGPFTRVYSGMAGQSTTTWTTICEVWRIHDSEPDAALELDAVLDEIITAIERNPTLGGVALDSGVTSGDEVVGQWLKGGAGPAWLMAQLNITWQETQYIELN